MNTEDTHGFLSAVTPKRLSKKDQNHNWLFAVYHQFASNRSDGRDYKAFLFRSEDRTVFGIKEVWDEQIVDFRKLATNVIQDKEFRDSLISDDPDLPRVWKRH